MKRFILTLTAIFICTIAYAHTINWYVGNTILETTTCDSGDSITPPTAPYKYGYTFNGWANGTPIEYLESTGTQYIDTGVILSSSIEFYTVVAPVANNICGFTSAGACLIIWQGDSNITFRPGIPETSSNIRYSVNTFYDIGFNIDQKFFTVNDTKVKIPQNIPNFNSTIITGVRDKIKLLKIYDNDILVRDFIPGLDKDGVPCMYDKVEGKFYYNAGTGQFIAGPVIGE